MTNTGPADVFCDTSVLLACVFGGSTEASRLVIDGTRSIVVSEKVREEFFRVPERRDEIYEEFIRIVTGDDDVADAAIDRRDALSPNDERFIEELRDQLSEIDSPNERLRLLRERQRLADRRHGTVTENITRVCDRNDDLALLFAIGSVIENNHDCQVVVDAAGWSHDGGAGGFATRDYDDMIDNARQINRQIRDKYGESGTLAIQPPEEFS